MMKNDNYEIEYKDFSQSQNLAKNVFMATMFKTISAFANSGCGKIIIGQTDQMGVIHSQPINIIAWLENDSFVRAMNNISNHLIVLYCDKNNGIITVIVNESNNVISAKNDFEDIQKDDCFIRDNSEIKKATEVQRTALTEKKLRSVEPKMKELAQIVHKKYALFNITASNFNIFDSIVISYSLSVDRQHIKTVFEMLVEFSFIYGIEMPLSSSFTVQMMLDMVSLLSKSNNNLFLDKKKLLVSMYQNKQLQQLIQSYKRHILTSRQLECYILEHAKLE